MKPTKFGPIHPFNNNDWASYNKQQRNLNLQADINSMDKQSRYMEWIISACVGASIALIFVIVHQIFFV